MHGHADVSTRAAALACCAALLAGCAKERPGAEGAARDTAVVRPAAAAISLADVAGTWNMRSTDPDGANPLDYRLTAAADGSDWIVVMANRPPVHEHVVAVAGDSIVVESDPYESGLRPGVQVRVRDVYRLRDGKLVSTIQGRFITPRGDSLAERRSEGTRAQ